MLQCNMVMSGMHISAVGNLLLRGTILKGHGLMRRIR